MARYRFEEQAFPYLDELFASAMHMTRQRESAEDLVSDVFSSAWKSFRQAEPETSLRLWLYKFLINTYTHQYGRKPCEPLIVELDRPDEADLGAGGDLFDKIAAARGSLFASPEAFLAKHILNQDIRKAVEGLPEEFRMVVILSDAQNFACQEIADILDIPLSAARSRLWRGRRRLQRILWKQAQLSQEDQRALEAAPGAEEAYSQGRGPGGACSGPSVWPRLAAMGMSASDSKGTDVI